MTRKVFRLQQIPIDADRRLACKLVSTSLGINPNTVSISSLACSVNPYNLTKVATLIFTDALVVEDILQKSREGSNIVRHGDEWNITAELDELDEPVELILDTHFKGLTPLHDPMLHIADCIAISGLASHPFGSWQPKGDSKTFMWIRDALPRLLPNIRPILYGYDTTLQDCTSFQLIDDLSLDLISQLKAHGWSSPDRKPLVFLAHSLGGLILKQAIVTATDKLETDNPIVRSVQGAVFFGTPNYGMEQSQLMEVVRGQYNEKLVADLSPSSSYLRQLDNQFNGISFLKKSQLYWCYETKASPTVTYDSSGKLTRTGHEHILVTRESATRGIFEGRSGLEMAIPINETHSNMVKFTQGSKDLTPVVRALGEIISLKDSFQQRANGLADVSNTAQRPVLTTNSRTDEAKLKLLTKSLCTPDENRRLEEVEERFQNTFDWIYDRKETRFAYWLQSRTGLFWINGKPGAGKSTLMKFIYQDPRTHELLGDWKKDKMICAAFFFHHRGNTLQKSFAGLLQSILFQIVSERSDLGRLLLEFYDSEERWSLSNLEKSFRKIVFQDEIPLRLCLFLDALDEYDGQLEFLCKFLKDLEEIQPSQTKTIKVCFSSRPWEIFTTAFRNTPGFGIQKFTQEDIRDYCLGCMGDQSDNILQELVPNIVSRANGVFLWVQLVIKDLTDATKKARLSKNALQEHLNAFPIELDEYYAEIIKRIPYTNRWKAYAALEVIVRSTSTVTSEEVLVAVFGSNATTFQEGYNAWHAEFRQAKEPSFAKYATKKLKEYTGGLVEVVDGGWNTEYIQVFHQTVEDFVKDLQFKTLVLGEQAKITTENGHTFIGKALFMGHFATSSYFRSFSRDEPFHELHLRSAEHTTGRSIKVFLDSVPPGHFQSITDDKISGPLGYAAYAGLSLYIKESLISTPSILQDSHEELLSHAFFNDKLIDAERRRMGQDSVTIARLLLEYGFTPDKDPRAFERVLHKISANGSDSEVINILPLLIDYGQQVNIRVPCTHNNERGDAYYTPLHAICRHPHVINLLLNKGADVNGPDWKNRTAVDWILAFVPEAHLEHLGLYYQSMSMLLERGGRTNTTTSAVREQCLEVLSRAGFQTETLRFEEPSAPRPKQKRKKKRHAPTRKTQNGCIIL